MAVAERRADVVWRGDLQKGSGTFDLVSSEAARDLPVTWASRTERPTAGSVSIDPRANLLR